MVQIWKDNTFINIRATIEDAKEFCEKFNIENAEFIVVKTM